MELFALKDNLVVGNAFYRNTSKIPLLFELVLRLHQVQMRGYLILHVVNTVGTIIIEAGIDGISRGNNMGGMMRGLNPLKFVLLYL